MGKNVLVAGRSKNVGMPIAMLLHTDRNHERPGGKRSCLCVHVGSFVLSVQVSLYCDEIGVLLRVKKKLHHHGFP